MSFDGHTETLFTWDGLRLLREERDNQLIEARSSSISSFSRTLFSYDALGRRVTSYDGLNETLFVWDGLRLLREERGSNAGTYFYEQGSYAPLARVDCRNSLAGEQKLPAVLHNVFYYHCNPAGLPEDVTNSQGEVVWRGRYSTWGKLVYEHTTRHAPAGFSQPLRMQGQDDDGTTGLYYNMFRYYDADAGRYSAEDPIGLAGGMNLYRYAANPMTWADPYGLDATNWNNTADGRSRLKGPTNGNWGGACWSGGISSCNGHGNAPPTDSGDECYMRHDLCYEACGANPTKQCKDACDGALVDELRVLPDNSEQWARPPRPGTEGDSERYRWGAIKILSR